MLKVMQIEPDCTNWALYVQRRCKRHGSCPMDRGLPTFQNPMIFPHSHLVPEKICSVHDVYEYVGSDSVWKFFAIKISVILISEEV